jgi:hypothetical protein
MNKFTESLADVMRYIVNQEMGGLVDPKHHHYPTYLDIRDIFGQVKSDDETLDLETHSILTKEVKEESRPCYYHPNEVFNRNWNKENIKKT